MAPRSRLWWLKTRHILRIPAGNANVPAPTGTPLLTESGEDILTELSFPLTTEA